MSYFKTGPCPCVPDFHSAWKLTHIYKYKSNRIMVHNRNNLCETVHDKKAVGCYNPSECSNISVPVGFEWVNMLSQAVPGNLFGPCHCVKRSLVPLPKGKLQLEMALKIWIAARCHERLHTWGLGTKKHSQPKQPLQCGAAAGAGQKHQQTRNGSDSTWARA